MDVPVATEIMLLGWSVMLLLVHIALQGGLVLPKRGLTWNAGPRDEGQPPLGRYSGRSQRALNNYKETYPAFIALVLGLAITDQTGGTAELGAWLWFSARVLYLPLYVFGVPWVRSAAYGVSLAGLVLMLIELLYR